MPELSEAVHGPVFGSRPAGPVLRLWRQRDGSQSGIAAANWGSLRPLVVAPNTNASSGASLPTNPQRIFPPPHADGNTKRRGLSFSIIGTAGLVTLAVLFV